MDPQDEAQVDRVVSIGTEILGDTIIGIYLHGSAVLGGLQPSSDLDLLVIVRDAPDEAARRLLVRRLLDVSGERALHPGRPVELMVVAFDQLVPWSHPPRAAFLYGEWLRRDYEAGHVPAPQLSPDLTILLATVHRHGETLFGSPAATVVPAVPREDLVAATIAGADGLLEDLEGDERNVLLTFARMLVTVESGELVPKDVAANAVHERLDVNDGRLMKAASDDYRGYRTIAWSSHTAEVSALAVRLLELVQQRT